MKAFWPRSPAIDTIRRGNLPSPDHAASVEFGSSPCPQLEFQSIPEFGLFDNSFTSATREFLVDDTRSTVEMSTSELATSYAALILADDGVDITVRLPTIYIQSQY